MNSLKKDRAGRLTISLNGETDLADGKSAAVKRGKLMKKINWKILNAAFWIEIILSYLLPFRIKDNSRYQVGFPVAFISVNAAGFGINPFMSMHLNPLGLLFNGIIIYWIILFCIKAYQKHIRRSGQDG